MIPQIFKEGLRQLRRGLDHLLSPELIIFERRLEKKRNVTPIWNRQKLNWQKLRYSYHPSQRKLTKTGIAILLTALLMGGAAFPKIVYQVSVDETIIGTVRKVETAKAIINDYLDEMSQDSPYTLVVDPAVQIVPIKQKESLSKINDLKKDLVQSLNVKAQASVIYVGDKASIPLAGAKEVNQVLDNVKLYYVENKSCLETLQAKFSDDLLVRREIVEIPQIRNVDEATSLLVAGSERRQVVTVEAGDTLWDIALSQSISVDEILANNPDAESLRPGDQLVISQAMPLVGVVTNETTREEIVISYDTETRYSDSMFVTEIEEIQKGSDGLKIEEFAITRENGDEVSKVSLGMTMVKEPVSRIIVKGTQMPYGVGTGEMAWPLWGTVTAWYGWYEYGYHRGIDISSGYGYATVTAADSGVVVDIGYDYFGLGYFITIDHNNGLQTRYGHLNSFHVSYGEAVRKGDPIGVEGNTGYSFGNHLHFEVLVNGVRVNPANYLP
ncbi:MAG: peptidoglycan DD-metalloendopeptidase family protein [Firmicutes bacterium]|nr:peptidoglycan DD-metalloendopeptidase family protein [Bacillota bacterium]